jgi:hypothetical protein
LAVDTYQRDFVWNDDKVRQLADDLLAYEREAATPKPPYYMGAILLHQHDEKGRRFVIDGQQRLTALCVLHHKLTGQIPDQCELTYSPKSGERIRRAAALFSTHDALPSEKIFEQIVFTVICVGRVDLAFTFFDTQNNRGVPLHATDLLKAYHLRCVDGAADKEDLQKLCAQRWESIQQGKPVMSHEQEFAASLFAKFLWRARCWTGNRAGYGGHDALMTEFQQQTVEWNTSEDRVTIPLYRSRHNRLGTALTLMPKGHSEIHTKRILLSTQAEDLPFAIRQPIHDGVGFFLYADKYASLLRWLMREAVGLPEVDRFREVYHKLLMANSLFLREVFLLASLIYVDQFGDEKLWEFALWMEHALGAVRLEKQQVRNETAQNFITGKNDDVSLNLLDVIANSFRPEQVIAHLQTNYLKSDTYKKESIETGKGVQGVYKKAVLNYYERAELTSLNGKEGWLKTKIAEGLNGN